MSISVRIVEFTTLQSDRRRSDNDMRMTTSCVNPSLEGHRKMSLKSCWLDRHIKTTRQTNLRTMVRVKSSFHSDLSTFRYKSRRCLLRLWCIDMVDVDPINDGQTLGHGDYTGKSLIIIGQRTTSDRECSN